MRQLEDKGLPYHVRITIYTSAMFCDSVFKLHLNGSLAFKMSFGIRLIFYEGFLRYINPQESCAKTMSR
jgi:hypothetical protein